MNNNPNLKYSNSKTLGIIAYITLIGFIVALVTREKDDLFVRYHVNQALVIFLFSLLSIIPIVGYIWSIFIFVCLILGIVHAASEEMKPVPLIGKINIIDK